MNKKMYFGVVALAFFAVIVGVLAVVPADTIRTTAGGVSTIVVDHLNVTDTYYWTHNGTTYNMTEVVANLVGANSTDEWGLVFGTTGDWFNYTDITSTPVYIGLQIHPDNVTDVVLPHVYDKDDTKWQLALYWYNGTQYNKADIMVMYYAHVDWDNAGGLTYIEANQ